MALGPRFGRINRGRGLVMVDCRTVVAVHRRRLLAHVDVGPGEWKFAGDANSCFAPPPWASIFSWSS